MGPRRLAAVADTGPLIHLAEVGCLSLLSIFEELHIPEGVWREADRPATIRQELQFATRHTLEIEEVRRFTADHRRELYSISSLFVTQTIVDLSIERLGRLAGD